MPERATLKQYAPMASAGASAQADRARATNKKRLSYLSIMDIMIKGKHQMTDIIISIMINSAH
jgi:hypothetical protein